MRAVLFADLRARLEPEPSESVLGCMISMIRVTVPVGGDQDILGTTREIGRRMFRSGRSGAPYLFAAMSKTVVRMTLALRLSRIANIALSFLGKLELAPHYGTIELVDVHAFITNNQFGPQLAAFGKVLHGRIELDMNYLSSELSENKAKELLAEIQLSLEKLSE